MTPKKYFLLTHIDSGKPDVRRLKEKEREDGETSVYTGTRIEQFWTGDKMKLPVRIREKT